MNNAQLGCHLENGWSQNSRSKNIERKEKNELFCLCNSPEVRRTFHCDIFALVSIATKKIVFKAQQTRRHCKSFHISVLVISSLKVVNKY